jgi:hypothetical protein
MAENQQISISLAELLVKIPPGESRMVQPQIL